MSSPSSPLLGKFSFEYQEEVLATSVLSDKKLQIGVPKEDFNKEKRIPLTPNTVNFLVENGVKVLVEKDAGIASQFSNMEYSEAGAEIVEEAKEVYKADVILKIAPPNNHEIQLLRKNQVLISSLNLKTLDKKFFQILSEKKITAIALENITDENNENPFVELMSEIIGKVAVNIVSNFLMEKKGKLIGGIPGSAPINMIVIGAGAVARSTLRAALSQGANVQVYDNSISRLKNLQNKFHQNIYTSILHIPQLLNDISRADVVIGAISNYNEYNNFIIPKEIVKRLKKNSLIIDLSIDQGVCFETSQLTDFRDPSFEKYGVTHFGIPNISSMAPRSASYVLGDIFLNQFSNFQNYGNINHFLKNDENFRNGLYFYSGVLVNKQIGELFDLPTKDINLILTAF